MTPIRFFAALALVPCFAHQAIAQGDGTGRLEGIVVDSVHSRPLAGVKVLAVSAGSPTDVPRAAVSDSAGRYHFDALPSGRYMVGFESPLLDSLEIVLPPRAGDVATGSTATMTLAVPPAGKLRAAVCSGATLPPRNPRAKAPFICKEG